MQLDPFGNKHILGFMLIHVQRLKRALRRFHGAARDRMIATNCQQTDCDENVSVRDPDPEIAHNVVIPVRDYPVYKRRASQSSPHFRSLDLLVKQLDFIVDSSAYATLLKRCNCPQALESGKAVHEHIISRGRGKDLYLTNLLIQMYGNCRSLEDASAAFEGMKKRDVFSWNMMIAANALNGKNRQALWIYYRMLQAGFWPTEVTFTSLIPVCASIGAVAEGKTIHSHIKEMNYDESNVEVMNSLIKMYGKFRLLNESVHLFEIMPVKDVTSFSAMITAYAKCNQLREAVRCFERMWTTGLTPSIIAFTSILGVCAELGAVGVGCEVHAMINEVGYKSFIHTLNVALFDMYARCGELHRARAIFDNFQKFDVTSWNLMIAAYARKGEYAMAVELADRMQSAAKLRPTVNTFISLLATCKSLEDVKKVQKRMQMSGVVDGTLNFDHALITKLGRLGAVDSARSVLEKMAEKNVVSWSAMVSAYVQNGYSKQALRILQRMDLEGTKPNKITFTSLMEARYDEQEARAMYRRICSCGEEETQIQLDDYLRNAVLRMLFKSGSFDDARSMFEGMEKKDVVTWTTAIAASAAEEGRFSEAFTLFQRMELEGLKPTSVTFLSLVDACSSLDLLESVHQRVLAEDSCRNSPVLCTALIRGYFTHKQMDKARSCFQHMETKDVVTWTSMIRGYAEQQQANEALLLFRKMQSEGVKPNHITLVNMLDVCCSLGSLHQGRKIHSQLAEIGGDRSLVAGNELVRLYGECGSVEEAKAAFEAMEEKGSAACTALMAAFVKAGRGRDALKQLRRMEMEGVKPNRTTYSTALAACSCSSGSEDEAWDLLILMERECGMSLTSEHYGCMIDVLGGAGRMDQAQVLMRNMGVKADAKIWLRLLNACEMHRELGLGEEVAEEVMKLEPMNPEAYLKLARMYGAAGERDKEIQVLAKMEYKGIKPTGYKYQFC